MPMVYSKSDFSTVQHHRRSQKAEISQKQYCNSASYFVSCYSVPLDHSSQSLANQLMQLSIPGASSSKSWLDDDLPLWKEQDSNNDKVKKDKNFSKQISGKLFKPNRLPFRNKWGIKKRR